MLVFPVSFLECIEYFSSTLLLEKLLQNPRFQLVGRTLQNKMKERGKRYCELILIIILCVGLTIALPLTTTSTPKDKIQKENIKETLWGKHNDIWKCFAEIHGIAPPTII